MVKDNLALESELTLQNSSGTSSKNDVSANLSFNLDVNPLVTFLNSVFLGLDRYLVMIHLRRQQKVFKEFGARHKHHGFYDYTDHKKYFGHGRWTE